MCSEFMSKQSFVKNGRVVLRKECQRLIYNKIGINFYKVDRLSNNHLLENLTTV